MTIAIGTPISRLFDWRVARSMMGLINDARGDCKFIVRGNHERPMPIEQARNEIARQVVQEGHEWLLWFDSDATAVYGTLKRLLSWRVPIVSALCFKRKYPVTPACGIRDELRGETYNPPPVDNIADWLGRYGQLGGATAAMLSKPPEDSLLAVDVVGTHCALVHRSVLEAIPDPRYERTTPPEHGSTGSDWDFCIKAKAAGFPIYVDRSVVSGHLEGAHEIAGLDFMAWTIWTRWVCRNVPESIIKGEE